MANKREQILAEVVSNISTLELARAVTRIEGVDIHDVLNALNEIEDEKGQ